MQTRTEESNLVPYLRALWARRWLVVAVTALLAVASLAYSAVAPKSYTATSRLLLEAPLPTALLAANGSNAYQAPVNPLDAVQVVASGAVARLVAAEVGQAPAVSAVPVANSDVVAVSVTSSSPQLAQKAATAYAKGYITYEQQQTSAALQHASQGLQQELTSVEATVASLGQQITASGGNAGAQTEAAVTQAALQADETTLKEQMATYQMLASAPAGEVGQLITPAGLPRSPSSPAPARNLMYAVVAGVVLGALAALALQYRDDVAARQRMPHLANGAVGWSHATVPVEGAAGGAGPVTRWGDDPTVRERTRTSKGGIR